MPVHLSEPSPDVPARVKSKLHAFADDAQFTTKALRGARKDQLDVSTPHEVFTLGLNDITAGGGLDRAQPVGWRYLIVEGGQPIATAETAPGPDGTQEVSQFAEGPFVAATDKAVKILRRLPELEAKGFELRLLRIPALYMMALWLHAPDTDLLVPLEPSPVGKAGKRMRAEEFFSDLSELARSAALPGRPDTPGSTTAP